MANADEDVETKKDPEKSDDLKESSDNEAPAVEENKEVNGKAPRRKRRRREIDRILAESERSDDDSGNEEHGGGGGRQRSKDHSATREPRSCVLSQRQKRKPLSRLLEQLLRNLEKKDQNQFFAWPVTDNYAPNYSTIIKRPMDFSTMKQKIDENQYKSLNCFIADFKLMCGNAMKYNKSGTVYHKAARKLLHLGMRQLVPAKLRPLGNILTYMYEIPIRELGFDMGKMDVKAIKADEANRENNTDCEEEKTPLSPEDQVKLKMEEIREQHRRRLAKRAFPRMGPDGYTSLQVLVDNDGILPNSNQRPVSLGLYTGKISHGTGTIQGFKEDRRNMVKGVKPLNYGAFGSYAPSYDSTFATVSKEDCHLLYHSYGDETGISTNESFLRFAADSPWSCIYDMEEMFPTRSKARPSSPVEETETPKNEVKIDVEKLKTLSDLGIDVDFLSEIEDEIVDSQHDFGLEAALKQNMKALKKLEAEQKERLSLPIPAHLSNVPKPTLSELESARVVVSNLKDMVSRVQPLHVAPLISVRKAMGVTLDHLDTPMTVDELHEISPEHANIPDQLTKESNHSNDDTSSTIDNSKSEDLKSDDLKSEDLIKSEEESIENGDVKEEKDIANGVKED